MHIPLYEEEILWGRKGKTITVYTVDGSAVEYNDFCVVLGEAVSECYRDLNPSTIQKLWYINDYGEQPRTKVAEWSVRVEHGKGEVTFTIEES